MFFRSERLFLRPGWPEDWADLFRQIADAAIVHNLARAPWPYGAGDARAFAALPQDRRFPHFFITLPQTSGGAELIGCIGLHPGAGAASGEPGQVPESEHPPELGYWIARERWGQGYATEAGRAVLAIARTLGHRLVRANHFVDNAASGRVLAKLGFRPTGACEPRFSVGRGEMAPAQVHLLHLAGAAGGGDDDHDLGGNGSGGAPAPMSRAA
ncbi:GNAT family N-acetyltransferase [Novosphingobium bradum]|uniref:GNAT family N-acetyltransferase n=1 Tax=Novosphingobium bradum TaxID=1737444 RepID=A0ABV7IKG0_9SPHN